MNTIVDVLRSSFGQTVLATLVSIGAGWVIARVYYRKATLDLVEENRKLVRQITLILRALENAGLVKLVRNTDGEVVSIAVELKADLVSTSSMTATLSGGDSPPPSMAPSPRRRFWHRWR